jgi:NTP pyrophosphatase (non-canonical NTP hydrolase)
MTIGNDTQTTLQEVKDAIRSFTEERDWQQFHTLKNLAMAVVSESAELMAHFRWDGNTPGAEVMQDTRSAREIRHEVADVMLLLAEFANVAKIDIAEAVAEKLEINARRYPIDKSKGIATKYDRL